MRSLNATCSPCHSPLRFSPRRLDLDADTSFFFSFATYVSCFLGGQFIRMESSRTYSFVSCFNSLLVFEIHPWSCSRLCFAHLRCCVVFHCVDMAQFIVLQLASLILFALVTTASNPAVSAVVTPVLWFLRFPQFQIATVS